MLLGILRDWLNQYPSCPLFSSLFKRDFCTQGMKLFTNRFTELFYSFLSNSFKSCLELYKKLGTELGSQRKLSWILRSTSCFLCYRLFTIEFVLVESIFSICLSKMSISKRTTQLLIQLVLRQCMASMILSYFFSSPQLLYYSRSIRLPFQKQPDTQFFLAVFLKMPFPSNTPFLNYPIYRLPFLNSFSPNPFKWLLAMYPLSTILSSNSSQFLCVQGLQPPWLPLKIKVKASPLMSPFFQKPIVSLLPYFCQSILLAFLISYFIAAECVFPIKNSNSAIQKTLLRRVISVQSSLASRVPFLKVAQVIVLLIQFSSLDLPSNWLSVLQYKWAIYPSVLQTASTIFPLIYSAERRQCWEKNILWPCIWSLRQLVTTERPLSCIRIPLPSFLKELIPPMYIAFLQWQKQRVLVLVLLEWAGLYLTGVFVFLVADFKVIDLLIILMIKQIRQLTQLTKQIILFDLKYYPAPLQLNNYLLLYSKKIEVTRFQCQIHSHRW